ncbi:UNVERIFIED_CONTAM: hypothetical protein Sradi_6878400 [Sesamum radiatum]|uniref:Endonuclease/exonuclease/phosphatase domain-containing protein n=1 Tax=Sesamum radiatum TaxID=300843 RepID=A0AAW2JJD5_SESRA
MVGRRDLWGDLVRISHVVAEPWVVGGDFNTVVDTSEVCGHSGDVGGAAEEFQGCLRDTGLIALPMQGEWFTWHNCNRDSRSLWKRLDRILVNDWWLESWPNSSYMSLNARTSDHSPLVIRGDTPRQTASMFRFDNCLARSADFIPSVRRIWQHHIVGTAMFGVTRKLKALKQVFRAQRQRKGDLTNNVRLAAGFLEEAQSLLAQDRHCETLLHLELCCKVVLRLASRLEQNMLQQRAKMAWMKDGDQSSRIFFRRVAKRRSSKPSDFNLGEFLALANRVVDVGDVEALAALEALKMRPAPLLLTHTAGAGQIGDETMEVAPILGLEAPPPRVLEERPDFMQTRVSSNGTLAAQAVGGATEMRGTTVARLIGGVAA